MIELAFDPERHEYSVYGEVIPSVTHIIRFLACDVAAGASASMRDAAAERGSRIHEACGGYFHCGNAHAVTRRNATVDTRSAAAQLYEYFIPVWNSTVKRSEMERFGWPGNPWVWVIEFERIGKEDAET